MVKIWQEYMRGVEYNRRMGLYEQVKKNEDFYIGRQWEGLGEADELSRPVINVLKRVVSYFISMIVSDDVAVQLTPHLPEPEREEAARVLEGQVAEVIEQAGIKAKCREIIRDAAVDGEGYLYLYFDPNAPTGQAARGRICAEVVDNVNVIFGNPYSAELQRQPYIMIAMRCEPDALRREAAEYGGDADLIRPDDSRDGYDITGGADGLCTAVLKLWRDGEKIRAVKVTRDGVVRPCWETGCSRYPLAAMRWEKIKNCYHGMAAVTSAIPNQISINQLFAMAIHSVKATAFPKIIFDRTKLRGWSGKVGQAIGVVGNPNDAIASSFRGADMSPQVTELIERMCRKTLEFMGASDAALGNITPDNTSAIIATQKASAMPLELQRMEFFRFTEDYVRIILDIIRADYGVRRVAYETEGARVVREYDLGRDDPNELALNVEVGTAAYWSEVMQVQTLDNLFSKGIIPDALTYLESIPPSYIRGKGKIMAALRRAHSGAVNP